MATLKVNSKQIFSEFAEISSKLGNTKGLISPEILILPVIAIIRYGEHLSERTNELWSSNDP